MKAIKIIAGITLTGLLALAYLAIREAGRAEYWANYRKTEPARQARHRKPEESELEGGTEPKENNDEKGQ